MTIGTIAVDVGRVQQCLKPFERYFTLVGHQPHFEMMVRGADVDDLLEAAGLFASDFA